MNNKRYDLIDTLRGLAIISMIAFHTCWLMNHFGLGITTDTLFGPVFMAWERSICISFITIAGFSFSLGHRHFRSGLIVFLLGAIITVVTCIFLPQIRIVFGVLTFIGSATLLMIPIDKAIGDKVVRSVRTCIIGFVINLVLFLTTYNINKEYLGFMPYFAVRLPAGLYKGYFMTYLGFMEPGFFSTDYFSLIPWFFIYICGYFLHKIITASRKGVRIISCGIPGIRVLGRHSLPVYVIHPIVIYVLLYFVSIMT